MAHFKLHIDLSWNIPLIKRSLTILVFIYFMNPDSLGAVNKRVTTEVLRKRKSEPNLSESDSEYSTDNSSRSKRKYRGNLFIFIF